MIPVIIAHGGIELGYTGYRADIKQIELKNAVVQGYKTLRVGNSSIDAVEKTIVLLEDNENFNAGYDGSVFNAEGEVELDAGMMNGTGLKVGAVGAVKDIANPIILAKQVMVSTEHSLLVGEGARKYAAKINIPSVSRGVMRRLESSEDYKKEKHLSKPETCTVGVVAIDSLGQCAVGSSSGGGLNKMPGRVGSSAIVGAGFYTDSSIGGSVATGHGESIIQSCLCFNLISQMAIEQLRGDLTMLAVKNVVEKATRRAKNAMGIVALDRNGDFGVAFSAPRMSWVYCRSNKLRFGAESGENYIEYVL